MSSDPHPAIATDYRMLYGKLYAAFLQQFGSAYSACIEDAIQHAFYRSIKTWGTENIPENRENWLYIVARNDLLNQMRHQGRFVKNTTVIAETVHEDLPAGDLRLQTLLFLAGRRNINTKAKVLFVLKNIFGLSVSEIAQNTLHASEAVYKSINRSRKLLYNSSGPGEVQEAANRASDREIALVEEILYGVFNIGFDSFREKSEMIINPDLCAEALALAGILHRKYRRTPTSNLIALFCFHISRIPAKTGNHRFVPFFQQDRTQWDRDFMAMGFRYLKKPDELQQYYIEALIAGKYMTTSSYGKDFWQEIIRLYNMLLQCTDSPIVRLNVSYCYYRAGNDAEAIRLLNLVAGVLPENHTYLTLVRAAIYKNKDPEYAKSHLREIREKTRQKVRREHLSDFPGFDTFDTI
ncbi:RNA polymerase sigma-70 factor, ECF subfamily [Sinomicrobium oceani]|uniref:RNA polymerase sigma-70 factor, ECF subfamily n=1 Tax=Sinomicrobium oceani TaxID=1150368 RepID=A0A1K1QIA1_9FLAO|nr:DUF6596 domain-containing protein [Sinomicrobium oceani]SFW59412.1 RNA polymerase sigma-70 factor, ECF subfamily [Sinomicrobium oceani]